MSRLTFNIIALSRCSAQYRSEKMAAHGLKGCHISYLLHICHCPGISQDRLAQRIYINKSNVARQAAFLEEQGFITRRPCETDKRVLELYPTEKAQALLPEVHAILDQWSDFLSEDVTPEELETVNAVLDKMRQKAGSWMNVHEK